MLQVTVPSGAEEGTVECEVVGSVVEIDRAAALIQESIQQSELSRRRKALHSRQKTRKPAVRGEATHMFCGLSFEVVLAANVHLFDRRKPSRPLFSSATTGNCVRVHVWPTCADHVQLACQIGE